MPIIAIALLIAAALGGGTAYAAQSSLPGDPLWNFKTTVNENVQGMLATDAQAKANWDISVAADRLEEAQQLAQDGKLDADAQAKLGANFDAHAKEVAALVAKLKADGKASAAADVATRFQATLAAHAADVSAAAGANAETDIAPLLSDIRGTLDAAATLSEDASADASGTHETGSEDAGKNDTEASTSGSASAGTQVHTGTSVRGGQGGIETTGDGTVVGI